MSQAKAAIRGLRQLDQLIEDIYTRKFPGVQINMMDIPKVFEAGRQGAFAKGPMVNIAGIEEAITVVVNQLRRN